MSNTIFAEDKIKEVNQLWMELAKTVSINVDVLEDYKKTASTLPSQYLAQIEKIRTSQEKQVNTQKKLQKTQRDLDRIEKQRQRTRLSELKLQKDRERAFDKYEKQLKTEERLLNKTQGLYNKVQAGINNLTRQYNDLALRKELNGKLSDEEIITLGKLEAKLSKYQGALKRVDANIGKHNRNVGNYKSTFDGLGFSVAQLTREMPAFANSLQTGFMAISNNIPMLTDEINKLKKANVELAAQGKPTVSVLKQLGKAVFSVQSLISVGVTLLTVYGAKLFDSIFATDEATKATKEYNEQLAEENKNLKENIELRKRQLAGAREFVNQNLSEFQKVLNDLTRDGSDVEAVLTELSQRLATLGIKDAEALRNADLLASDRLVIASNLLEINEQQIRLDEERVRLSDIQAKKDEINLQFKNKEIGILTRNKLLGDLQSTSLTRTIEIQKEINRLNLANQEIISKTAVVEIETERTRKDVFKQREKELTLLEKYNDELEKIEGTFRQIRTSELEPLKIPIELDAPVLFDDEINILNEQLDELGRLYDIDARKFSELFDSKKNTVRDYVDAAGEAVTGLYNLFQKNYEDDLIAIQESANLSLQFVEEGSAAEAEIQRQLQERKDEIRQKQLKQEKDAALFNIFINTARGITAALTSTPPNVPLSIAIGAIGAAQAVSVASREIPAFKDGVRGFEGGTALVNDAKGSNYKEVITTPQGDVFTPQKRNVLMDLPKGSNVYKNYAEFESELDNLLGFNGILPERKTPSISIEQNGLNKSDLSDVIGRLEKTIRNSKESEINFDESGFSKFLVGKQGKTQILNNRFTFKGRSI